MIRRYRRHSIDVEAIQNDGTDSRAMAIAAWVRVNGSIATAMPIGTVEDDLDHAYVHVVNNRAQKVAGPGMWVVKLPDDLGFHVVSNSDFHYLYYELDGLPEEPTA